LARFWRGAAAAFSLCRFKKAAQAKSLQPNTSSSVLAFGGNKDEHKSDDARSANLKLASFDRSDRNSPNEPATQRYSNATGRASIGAVGGKFHQAVSISLCAQGARDIVGG
jgi:hypothetical protein